MPARAAPPKCTARMSGRAALALSSSSSSSSSILVLMNKHPPPTQIQAIRREPVQVWFSSGCEPGPNRIPPSPICLKGALAWPWCLVLLKRGLLGCFQGSRLAMTGRDPVRSWFAAGSHLGLCKWDSRLGLVLFGAEPGRFQVACGSLPVLFKRLLMAPELGGGHLLRYGASSEAPGGSPSVALLSRSPGCEPDRNQFPPSSNRAQFGGTGADPVSSSCLEKLFRGPI